VESRLALLTAGLFDDGKVVKSEPPQVQRQFSRLDTFAPKEMNKKKVEDEDVEMIESKQYYNEDNSKKPLSKVTDYKFAVDRASDNKIAVKDANTVVFRGVSTEVKVEDERVFDESDLKSSVSNLSQIQDRPSQLGKKNVTTVNKKSLFTGVESVKFEKDKPVAKFTHEPRGFRNMLGMQMQRSASPAQVYGNVFEDEDDAQ
jgi:hypothetical protein